MNDRFVKVLIVGQPFNNHTGGGITLSNLFRGWPVNKIAVLSTGHNLHHVSTDVCSTYYRLGNEEYRWRFPFSMLQRNYTSGPVDIDTNPAGTKSERASLRHIIVHEYFYPLLKWLGLYHAVQVIETSEKLKGWINDFQPDLLYFQVSSRYEIIFANRLIDMLCIPAAIHMMDDWPSTISRYGIFRSYWSKTIDTEFRILLGRCKLLLSICEAMSNEYMRRYNYRFIPFHNPIDTSKWSPGKNKDYRIDKDNVKMLYSGRIGVGISNSLLEAAKAADKINSEGVYSITFHIQSPSIEKDILDKLSAFRCVIINPVAKLEELPAIYSDADILLLANDFSTEGRLFLRFSLPTKASEYMISGTPVLVYAPAEAAVSLLFREYNCGLCITDSDQDSIENGIVKLLEDMELRKLITANAVAVASERFDSSRVRHEFQKLLLDVVLEDSRTRN